MIEFEFKNPVTLFFGENQMDKIISEVKKYGNNVLLILGSGSFKTNGYYTPLVTKMKQAGLTIYELENNKFPSLNVARQGIKLCSEKNINIVLGIGGGVCMDLAKTIAFGAVHSYDIWEYLTGQHEYDNTHLPVGTIVTYPSSGSEMNGAVQITNDVTKEQAGLSGIFPNFAWLNPEYIMSIPTSELAYAQITSFVQVSIGFLSLERSSISESVSIAVMKEILSNLTSALNNPLDKNSRANMLLSSALNVNGILNFGKAGDWSMYPLQTIMQNYYNVNYTRAITIMFPYWLEKIYGGQDIFKKYFKDILEIDVQNILETELLKTGKEKLFTLYKKFGIATSFKELKSENKLRKELYQSIKNMGEVPSQYGAFTIEKIIQLCENSIG